MSTDPLSNPGEKFDVLHIDDEIDQLIFTKRFLENSSLNICVQSALSPKEGLTKIKLHSFDCIVLDYKMPEMNGIELARIIKAESRIPVILYTGHGSEEVAEEAFEAGIDDYIRKELDPSHYKILAQRIKSTIEKQRAINKLEESEAKYRSLIEQSLQGIIIAQGFPPKIVFANPSVTKIWGYSLEELLSLSSESVMNLIHPEVRDNIVDNYKNRLEDVSVQSRYEFRGVRKDGSVIWLEIQSNQIEFLGKKSVQAIVVDISERKKAVKKLEESQKHFKTLFNMMVDPVVIVDDQGNILETTEGVEEITGYKREDLIKNNFLDLPLLTEESKKVIQSNLSKRFKDIHTPPYPIEVILKDGKKIPFEINAQKIVYKGEMAVMAVFRNLSERNSVARVLRESGEKFRNLAENSPNMIFINKQGKVVYVNKKCVEKMGYTKEQFYSPEFSYLSLIAPESRDLVIENFKKSMEGKDLEPYEYTLITRTGEKIDAIISSKTIEYEGVRALLGIVTDITQRKQMERDLRDYTTRLEKRVEERTKELVIAQQLIAAGRVASTMAHDLRGPLQTIKNSVYLAKKTPENFEEYLNMVEDAVDRAADMVEETREKIRDTPIELDAINFADLIKKVKNEIPVPPSINLNLEIDVNLNGVFLDSNKIHRVLENLILNAIEAMPNGGDLTLKAGKKNGNLVITISDTGVGIPEAEMKNLFKPFRTTKSRGLGLGLTYCKRIVRAHEGEISVESKEGEGTSFTLNLPQKAA